MTGKLSRRITIGLDEETYAVVRRLSTANGEPMSKIVSGLVESVAPALARVADVAEAAATAGDEVRASLRESVDRSEAILTPLFAEVLQEWDAATSDLVETARPPSSVSTGVGLGGSKRESGTT